MNSKFFLKALESAKKLYNDVFNNKIQIQIYICDLHIREYIGQIPFGKIWGKVKKF